MIGSELDAGESVSALLFFISLRDIGVIDPTAAALHDNCQTPVFKFRSREDRHDSATASAAAGFPANYRGVICMPILQSAAPERQIP